MLWKLQNNGLVSSISSRRPGVESAGKLWLFIWNKSICFLPRLFVTIRAWIAQLSLKTEALLNMPNFQNREVEDLHSDPVDFLFLSMCFFTVVVSKHPDFFFHHGPGTDHVWLSRMPRRCRRQRTPTSQIFSKMGMSTEPLVPKAWPRRSVEDGYVPLLLTHIEVTLAPLQAWPWMTILQWHLAIYPLFSKYVDW